MQGLRFPEFIYDDDALYDGIAIDVGGPVFSSNDEFDTETCDAVRARLAPGGRIVMECDCHERYRSIPDRIAARLAGDSLRIWIVDEQGILDRNAVIAACPKSSFNARSGLNDILHGNLEKWSIRRGRLASPRPDLRIRHG